MKNLNKLALGASGLALSASSFAATGPDFSTLTGGIDFGSVITAVLAIAVTLGGVKVAIAGARKVLGMIR